MGQEKDFDSLLTYHVGEFGRYQKFVFVTLSFVAVAVVTQNLVHVFTGAELDHVCAAGETPSEIHNHGNRSQVPIEGNISHWRDSLNGSEYNTEIADFLRCHLYSFDNYSSFHGEYSYTEDSEADSHVSEIPKPVIKECDQWIYDTTQYKSSIVSQWDLVCDKSWIVSLCQSMHFIGCLIGALIGGYLSDRFGRRKILLLTTFTQAAIAIVTAFSPTWEIYGILRLLVGVAGAAQFNCAYITAIEIVGPRWRNIGGIMLFYFNSVGIILLAVVAYFVREWWLLQIAISVPLILLFSYYWIAPESPRWLIANGKPEEAAKLLRKMVRWNRTSLPDRYTAYLTVEVKADKPSSYSITDLIRLPKLRYRTIILCILWFTNSTTYYGLSMNTSNIGGNDYLNFFLSGVVELPAYTFCIWSINRLGRKYPLSGSMMLGGVALLATMAFPEKMHTPRVVLCMMGKLAISVAYCCVYPFTVEQYPTVVRNSGLGITSMFARIAGFISPYVLYLGKFEPFLPLLIMGAMSVSGGILCLILPETRGKPLPESIDDLPSIACFSSGTKKMTIELDVKLAESDSSKPFILNEERLMNKS